MIPELVVLPGVGEDVQDRILRDSVIASMVRQGMTISAASERLDQILDHDDEDIQRVARRVLAA